MCEDDDLIALMFPAGLLFLAVLLVFLVSTTEKQREQDMSQAFMRTGDTVVVSSVSKDSSRDCNSYFWVTAQKFNGEPEEQSTFRIDGEKGPIPQAGEVWRITRDGYQVLFKKRLEAAR